MPSLTAKQIDGHTYYYARYCQRVDGKPKIVRQVYLGKIEDLVASTEQAHIPPQPLETQVASCGDIAALWEIAQRLDLVPLLDSLFPKRHQGLSCGQYLLLAALNRAIAPTSKVHLADWYKTKAITGYQSVITDHGVADKRLLVIEPEFASVLRVAGRDGNTLSTVYRQAWDSGLLRVLNKNSPVKATGAHISIIGHITRDELLMELSNNDKVNGFGNRNLWLCVQRSKFLPDGGDWDHLDLGPLISRLKDVVEFAREVGEMRRDAEAGAMWHEVYPQLSGERGGLFGSLTSRAEAHVLRLSCIYALLDRSAEVRRCHLEAALALWKYCEDSAEFIFGTAQGNQVVDQILKALRSASEGLTRNDLRDLFGRHRSSEEIGAALRILSERDLVESEKGRHRRPTGRALVCSQGRGAKSAKRAERRGGVMPYRAYRAYGATSVERKHHA